MPRKYPLSTVEYALNEGQNELGRPHSQSWILYQPWHKFNGTSHRFQMGEVQEWRQSGSIPSQGSLLQGRRWWTPAWKRWRRGKASSWPGSLQDTAAYLRDRKKERMDVQIFHRKYFLPHQQKKGGRQPVFWNSPPHPESVLGWRRRASPTRSCRTALRSD